MILGLATRDKEVPLKTRKAAEGLYVVLNAYDGRYSYFELDDSQSFSTCGTSDHIVLSQDQSLRAAEKQAEE